MTPERWQRVKEIFITALEYSGKAREDFLAGQTNDDADLRREVDSLLAFSAQSDDIIEWNLMTLQRAEAASYQGRKVGAYTLTREIGRGGMGIVYEGLREEDFKQRVAVKLLRRGLGTDETIQRFRTERSALAILEHPGIARLLDGGSLPDGTPYFVMEYVEGVPIDVHCDEQKLDIRKRLELFCSVCTAVHYAHQHLIVHRDLKPGNIFVTSNGVKLLDFGIAKLLGDNVTEATLTQTQEGFRFFTPEYASPEQISGGNITTSSDTYSLGVLLYKLLTGQRPYQFKSLAIADVAQAIREGHLTRPSRVVLKVGPEAATNRSTSQAKLIKTLTGDLDTIVLKALQREPERRYASVQQFEEDIRRYLGGLPVSARRDSWSYRFSKLVTRNKLAATAIAAALLLLIAGIVSSLWQASKAERERDRAQAESEKAKQVISVLNEMLSAADPTRATGKDVTVAQVLDQASRRVEKEFANQPEIAADLLATIGASYHGLQLLDKARASLETALELQKRLHGGEHPETAEAMRALGEFHHLQEERSAAESLYTGCLKIFGNFGESSREYATAINDYGVFLQDEGKYDSADSLLHSALRMYHQIPGDNRRDIATTLHNLALNYDWQQELAIADSLYRESLNLQREVYGNNNVMIAITIGNLSFVAEAQGKIGEAERLMRESLDIRRSLLPEDHRDVVANKIRVGLFIDEHGAEYQEGEALCREALVSLLAHNPNLKRLIARAYLGIGRSLQKQGRILEAGDNLKQAVLYFEQAQPFNAQNTADAMLSLAENLIHRRRLPAAEQQVQRARDLLRNATADGTPEMKKADSLLAELNSLQK